MSKIHDIIVTDFKKSQAWLKNLNCIPNATHYSLLTLQEHLFWSSLTLLESTRSPFMTTDLAPLLLISN